MGSGILLYKLYTVKFRFLKPLREMKIGLKTQEVQEIRGKITEKYIQGKRELVQEIGRFENQGFEIS